MPAHTSRRTMLSLLALLVVAVVGISGALTLTAQPMQQRAATATILAFTSHPSSLPPQLRLTPSPTALPTNTRAPRGSSPIASSTPSATPSYPQCAWAWARQPLPEITEQVQTWLIEREFSASVFVEAYGENCIDYRGGTPSVAYFAAMTTDFYLTVYTTSLTDADMLAETYIEAYESLVEFIDETELPARPGYLTVTFHTPDYLATVRAMFDEVERALEDGLRGAALLEALGGFPLTPIPQPT